MSAFIVSHDCIARVVFAMRSARPEYLRGDPDALGMLLLDMNRRACIARYGANQVEQVEAFAYAQPAAEPHLLVQVYKSLRCYIYQCSEGDVPDEALYQQLVNIRDSMGQALGHATKGDHWSRPDVRAVYNNCEWG